MCVYTLPTRKNLLQKKIPPTFCANFNKTKTTNILSIVLIYNFPIQKKKKTDDISNPKNIKKSQRYLCIAHSVHQQNKKYLKCKSGEGQSQNKIKQDQSCHFTKVIIKISTIEAIIEKGFKIN